MNRLLPSGGGVLQAVRISDGGQGGAQEAGLAGPGLLAHVLVSKYADHLPLYRLSQKLARHRVEIGESTLMDWVAQCARLLGSLVKAMQGDLLLSRIIGTDDTPVPVQDKTRRQTRQGRLWVYVGDADHPQIVYRYTADRSRAGPAGFLKGWRGMLQADAYAGYGELYRQGVVEVGCWAYARRKFVEAQTTGARRRERRWRRCVGCTRSSVRAGRRRRRWVWSGLRRG